MPAPYDVRPLVSVIIPCYNQAAYLAQAIESALAQQYRHVEVVVVDDGSDEDVAGVVARYAGVRYVRQRNRGVSAARNHGFSVSGGDYVVFLDSDDRLTSSALCDQLRELEANSDAVAAVGLSMLIDADGGPLPFDQQPPVGYDAYCELLARNFVWMPAQVLYRRQPFAASGGFDSSVNACADYDLYLRLARTCRLVCHRAVVAQYRVHRNSMSRNAARMLRAALVVLARQRRFVVGSSRHR
ncbi:MAG: glycosyltransferase, partial [Bacteroidales bacterium]